MYGGTLNKTYLFIFFHKTKLKNEIRKEQWLKSIIQSCLIKMEIIDLSSYGWISTHIHLYIVSLAEI